MSETGMGATLLPGMCRALHMFTLSDFIPTAGTALLLIFLLFVIHFHSPSFLKDAWNFCFVGLSCHVTLARDSFTSCAKIWTLPLIACVLLAGNVIDFFEKPKKKGKSLKCLGICLVLHFLCLLRHGLTIKNYVLVDTFFFRIPSMFYTYVIW